MTSYIKVCVLFLSGTLLVSLRRDSRGHLNFIANPSPNEYSTTFDTFMVMLYQVKQKMHVGAETLEQHTMKQAHIKTAHIDR